MPNFSPTELSIVNEQRKDDKDLPKYYSSQRKTNVAISRDFEAYLILESQDHKQKTLSWIKKVKSISNNFTDRDALLSDLLESRKTQVQSRIKELDEALGNYDEFRFGILSNPISGDDSNKFADVAEVTLLTQILQKPIEYMNVLRERSYHEQVMLGLWENFIGVDGYSANDNKELSSWETVISAYPGQEGSTATNSGMSVGRP